MSYFVTWLSKHCKDEAEASDKSDVIIMLTNVKG